MLRHRSTEQEIMDDLNISGEVIDKTLRELNTINTLLGGNAISMSVFKKWAIGKNEITLADLGCGGGDILIQMAKWCRKKNIKAKFTGIDANPHIIEYARNNTKEYPEIEFECVNIFDEEFKKMKFDIIHCCLFTHHFDETTLATMFRQFKQQSKLGIIINDLQRHILAYWSIKILTAIFSRSYMVRNDAAVSVARGFTKRELKNILSQSEINEFQMKWKWAFRWQLCF